MIDTLLACWRELATTPVFGVALTVLAFLFAGYVQKGLRSHPLLHPNPVAIALIIMILYASGISYPTYFESAKFIHFLLGPATVALAIPLYAQATHLRRLFAPLLVTLVVGCLTAIVSAVGLAALGGASRELFYSLAPKSVTAPIAMGISARTGGMPSLTAAMVVGTGVLGALAGPWILTKLRLRDPEARGFAIGLSSHGLGTARALEEGEETGAFSALALGLNGLLTALLMPFLLPLLASLFLGD